MYEREENNNISAAVTVGSGNSQEATFERMSSYNSEGQKIEYRAEEAEIKGSEFMGLFEISEKTPHYIAVAAK